MVTEKNKRFRLIAFLLCALLIISGIVPLMERSANPVEAADNTITIYFDTGKCPDSNTYGFYKTMENLWYYTNSSIESDQNGTEVVNNWTAMTLTSIPSKYSTSGKVFKAVLDSSKVGYYITFTGTGYGTQGQKGMYRTARKPGLTLYDGIRIYDDYPTDWGKYRSAWFKSADDVTIEDMTNRKYAIANMTGNDVIFTLRYTDGTNSYDVSETVVARDINHEVTIPSPQSGHDTYTGLEIWHGSDLLKTYDFNDPQKKIPGDSPGNTFVYAITTYSSPDPDVYNEGDGLNVCFYEKGRYSLPNVTDKYLYFSADSFPKNAGNPVVTIAGVSIPIEEVNKISNASFKTVNPVNLTGSDKIIEVTYDGATYRLLWQDTSSDLIITSGNTKRIKGKYTVQTVDQTDTEIGDDGLEHQYTYRTVQADFFDYQYDHNTDGSTYNYSYTNLQKQYIYFQDNFGGKDPIYAHFYAGSTNYDTWPGNTMTYHDTNSGNSKKRYRIEIPQGATNVIFSYYEGSVLKQSEGVDLTTRGDKNCYYPLADTWSGNEYKVDGYKFEPQNETSSKHDRSYASEYGNAKRPYLSINEKLSDSTYAQDSNNFPMYLGQFWLPLTNQYGGSFENSSGVYTNATAANQRAAHNEDSDSYYYDTSNDGGYYRYFGFGKTLTNFNWSANLAYRYADQASGTYEPYNAVVQGLVDSTLSNGLLMAKDGTTPIPFFDKSWWTGSFINSQNKTVDMSDYLNTYEDYDFPFFKTTADDIHFKNVEHGGNLISNNSEKYKGDYYVFDSTKNVVRFKQENGATVLKKYYDKPSELIMDNYGSEGTTNDPGFFPFNDKSDSANSTNHGKDLHYGFGVKFSIDFYLPEYGTVDGESEGTPVTFTFQGDDDVWVFLDDKLILDMGGAHKNSIGEINFNDKKVYIGAATDVGGSIATTAQNKPGEKTVTFASLGFTDNDLKIGKHKITMFYVERGMLNSNLYVMFNLPTNISHWELQEDTDFTGINSGLLTATKMVADKDVFNYRVWNKGTETSATDMDSRFRYPTYTQDVRTNTEAQNQTTNLSRNGTSPSISTKTETIQLPTNRIYLEPGNWDTGGPYPYGAWIWDASDTSVKAMFIPAYRELDTNRLYVEVDRSRYKNIKWIKMNKDKYIEYRTFYYPPSEFRIAATEDKTIESGKNLYYLQSLTWGNAVTTRTETVKDYSQYYSTYNFHPSGNETVYDPLIDENSDGVTYKLTDKFSGNQVIYNTRQYGSSGDSNVISLQYSEMATLRKQFTLGSMMKVTQLDELSKPTSSGNRDENGLDDSGTRTVSDYYDTYLKSVDIADVPRAEYAGMYDVDSFGGAVAFDHVETMYGNTTVTPNYSVDSVLNFQVSGTTAEYNYQDPSDATNTCLHLRQVYVNAVRTADLTIIKSVNTTETNTDTFTFTIEFSNVFGGTEGDSQIDYSSISYSKNGGAATPLSIGAFSGGRFTVNVGDTVVIEGIPVGTHYTLTESTQSGYVIENRAGNIIDDDEITGDVTVPVMNIKQLGELRLQKLCYDSNGGNLMTGVTDKFPIIVTLTSSTSDLTKYSYSAVKEGNSINGDDFDITFTGTNTATITLMVTPSSAASFTTAVVLSGIPLDCTYSVSEGSDLPAGFSQAADMPTDSAFTNNSFNSNPSASYTNVFYKNSTHTISSGNVDIVTVENEFTPIVMPTTGGSGVILIFPFGILAITLSGAAFVIYKRRMTSGRKAAKGRYARK